MSRSFTQDRQGCFWKAPARAQIIFKRAQLAGVRQSAVPKQMRHFLERSLRRQIVDVVTRNGQPPRKAIYTAQASPCGDNAFETFLRF